MANTTDSPNPDPPPSYALFDPHSQPSALTPPQMDNNINSSNNSINSQAISVLDEGSSPAGELQQQEVYFDVMEGIVIEGIVRVLQVLKPDHCKGVFDDYMVCQSLPLFRDSQSRTSI
jgi:hypothetical protein